MSSVYFFLHVSNFRLRCPYWWKLWVNCQNSIFRSIWIINYNVWILGLNTYSSLLVSYRSHHLFLTFIIVVAPYRSSWTDTDRFLKLSRLTNRLLDYPKIILNINNRWSMLNVSYATLIIGVNINMLYPKLSKDLKI